MKQTQTHSNKTKQTNGAQKRQKKQSTNSSNAKEPTKLLNWKL